MATKTVVKMVCDKHAVDGDGDVEAMRTVLVPVGGRGVELDLCERDAVAFDSDLAPWMDLASRGLVQVVSRKTRGRKATAKSKARTVAVNRAPAKEIREWARTAGLQAGERGRIPADVIDAFQVAHA